MMMLNAIQAHVWELREVEVPEQQQTTTSKLEQLALKTDDLRRILQEAVIAIASSLNVDLCGVFELLPDGASMELSLGTGWKKPYVGRTVMFAGKESQEGYTLLTQEATFVENYFSERRFIAPALLRDHDVISGITVPIRHSNIPFGVLGAYSTSLHKFREQDLHILQSVANILSEAITRQEVEEALGMSEEKYRMLFEECKDAIFVSTPDGELIDMNPAGIELFGYGSKEEMLRINIQQNLFVDAEQRKKYQNVMFEHGYVKDFDLLLKTKTGRTLQVEETSTAVRDAKGNVVAYRGIIRDVTNIRRLQEELLHFHKMETMARLASHVAHDFNNVLITIAAYCELMRVRTDDDLFQDYVHQIEQAVQKGTTLTGELLSFSRRLPDALKELNLKELLTSLKTVMDRLVGKKVAVDLRVDPNLWDVEADRSQLEQMIINLVINARDAMPHGGTLVLETRNLTLTKTRVDTDSSMPPGEYVVVNLTDTGNGMDEMTKSHIFEPFFTTKERGKGTGLGLAIVYSTVKQSRGFISVQSALGEGTEITIYFPRAK